MDDKTTNQILSPSAENRENEIGPTQAQVDDACMWYRHDFGLLSEKERDSVRFEARQWFRAWGKALSNGDDHAALLRTPRGEGEDSRLAQIVRAILERIDRYQAFHDRVGPADLTLPPVARTITEEEIFALRAALRSEAQGEEDVGEFCDLCGEEFNPSEIGTVIGPLGSDDGVPRWYRCRRCARAYDAGYQQGQRDPRGDETADPTALRSEAQGEDRWEDVVFGPITEAYNEAHAACQGEGGGDG